MAQISGAIQKVNEKWEGKNGKRFRSPLFSVLVNDTWYGFGFDDPKVAEGDVVTFDATQGSYGWDADASTVSKAYPATQAGKSAVQAADARQTSIVYQSQHRDALEMVKFMVERELVKLPTKQADKYDAVLGLIKELTVQWTEEALNPDLSRAEDSGVVGDE